MKQETVSPDHRLRVYALALLLATFIFALHASILFGLTDFLTLFREWTKSTHGGRPADILVVIVVISLSFRCAHRGDRDVGSLFLEVGPPGFVW